MITSSQPSGRRGRDLGFPRNAEGCYLTPPTSPLSMPDGSEESTSARTLLISVIAVPVLYVLSIGPMARAALESDGGFATWFHFVYYPLGRLAYLHPVRDAMQWYIDFW